MSFLTPEHRGETLCLLLLAATGITLLVGAASLPEPMFDPMGPAGLPRWIGGLLLAFVALRLVVFARDVRAASRADKARNMLGAGERGIPRAEITDRPQIARLLIAAAITLAYVAILAAKVVPFVWVTMLFITVLGAAMIEYTPRKLITVAAIGVVMSLALTYVFTDVLSVVLPQ